MRSTSGAEPQESNHNRWHESFIPALVQINHLIHSTHFFPDIPT